VSTAVTDVDVAVVAAFGVDANPAVHVVVDVCLDDPDSPKPHGAFPLHEDPGVP